MSTADQIDLEAQVEKAKKKGFIHDSIKKWRKAKLQSNNEDYSVEFKLHGTSISPLVNGKKNLRIKFDDDKKYLDGTRQSNLINIFSKSAFFDYDTAKEIYKYCLIVGKNSSKYIAKNPPKNTPTTLDGNYGLKKKEYLQ